jgi:hypothetical protein
MHAMTVPNRRASLLAALAVALLLAACAPTAGDPGRVEVAQFSGEPSYYPQETGVRWAYLRDGARLDDPRYVESIEGPTVLDGDVWVEFRLLGGGQDVGHYRQFRPDGVYLKMQTRPGGRFTFEPPIREMPAVGELRVGALWSGETVATGEFPAAPADQRRFTQAIEYVYTVVDRREVAVGGRTFDVFVIDRTTRTFDEAATLVEELTQTIWFEPHVGKVRHENGWFLVETNFEAGVPTP